MTAPPLAPRLVGSWRLVSFEVVADGHTEYPFGKDPVGMLTYGASGQMSVQIMRTGRSHFVADTQDEGTAQEISAAFKSYAAYMGTYSVDEPARVVTHHVTASMFPNWVGTDQRRDAALDGDRLTLSTRAPRPAGGETLYRLTWHRLT